MKGAIASVEIYAFDREAARGTAPRRLTLTIAAPEREPTNRGEDTWSCRVALADLHRPTVMHAENSVSALAAALAQGGEWLTALQKDGLRLASDRAGRDPFSGI